MKMLSRLNPCKKHQAEEATTRTTNQTHFTVLEASIEAVRIAITPQC